MAFAPERWTFVRQAILSRLAAISVAGGYLVDLSSTKPAEVDYDLPADLKPAEMPCWRQARWSFDSGPQAAGSVCGEEVEFEIQYHGFVSLVSAGGKPRTSVEVDVELSNMIADLSKAIKGTDEQYGGAVLNIYVKRGLVVALDEDAPVTFGLARVWVRVEMPINPSDWSQ